MLNPTEIQKNVLEKIRSGKVEMRSRAYFVVRSALVGVAAFLVFAVALFTLSFIFFSIRESGVQLLLAFGPPGVFTFLTLFPWVVFFLCLALLVLLGEVMRRSTIAYRLPLVRLFGGILGGALVVSALLLLTPLHAALLSAADHDHLPLLRPPYEHIHAPHPEHGIYRGEIVTIGTSTFVIAHQDTDHEPDEGTWIIVPPAAFDLRTLSPGQKVFIAGPLEGTSTVRAFGIRVMLPPL